MHPLLSAVAVLVLGATMVWAQDPVQVAPANFRVEFENDRARVLRFNVGRGEKIPMHEHPPYVTVYLTDARARITLPGGKTRRVGRKAGETAWNETQTHSSEIFSDKPQQLILVELKGKPAAGKPAPLALDPLKIAGQHFKVEFENGQVRVLRSYVDSYAAISMHEHPHRVIVSLRDGHLKSILPDGNTVEIRRQAGEVAWRPATKHATENLSQDPYEEIAIEFKGQTESAL